jgi:hypothetical protein
MMSENEYVMNRILLRLGKSLAALQAMELTPEQIEAVSEIDRHYAAAVNWTVKLSEQSGNNFPGSNVVPISPDARKANNK